MDGGEPQKRSFKDIFESAGRSAKKQQYDEFIELNTRLLSVMFDKASAYLNVVTLGGYAAFFALWSLLSDDLSSGQRLWAGLLIGTSVLLFVGFEISKTAILQFQIFRLLRLTQSDPKDDFKKKIQAFELANQITSRIAVSIWMVVFPLCVATGVAGALVLVAAMAKKLWSLA